MVSTCSFGGHHRLGTHGGNQDGIAGRLRSGNEKFHFSGFLRAVLPSGSFFQPQRRYMASRFSAPCAALAQSAGLSAAEHRLALPSAVWSTVSVPHRLTLRSTGRATAGQLGPVGGTRYIFANRAKPSCRVPPVNSNVRRRRNLLRRSKFDNTGLQSRIVRRQCTTPASQKSSDNRKMLNRAALTVKPLDPILQWAKKLDDSGLIPGKDDESTIYLVPYILSEQHEEEILREFYSEIFERELFAWHTEEADWPKRRTLAMFKRWFEFELHSIVEDLCSYPILREDSDA